MKTLFSARIRTAAVLLLAANGLVSAQSPAATESLAVDGGKISIAYNAPKVNGRAGKLFGSDGRIAKDPNYPVWRAGANSATKFHTDVDLEAHGVTIPKGDYTLYVDLADPGKWQLIVNKQSGQWGLTYNKAQDAGRIPMTISKPPALVEDLKYTLAAEAGKKVKLTLAWENVVASVVFTIK
jgi:hypothetical protein